MRRVVAGPEEGGSTPPRHTQALLLKESQESTGVPPCEKAIKTRGERSIGRLQGGG